MAQYPTRNINDIDDLSRQTMNNKNNVAYERANRIFPTSWRGIHDGWISKPVQDSHRGFQENVTRSFDYRRSRLTHDTSLCPFNFVPREF